FFSQITERVAGSLSVEIRSDGDVLFSQIYPVDILTFDQWSGITVLPEMLSAFVTPNHPAIVPVINRAANILEKWTGSASLDEYQSRNPDRVRKQMAAVYTAIAEQNIVYSTLPAGFEDCGQRIRTVDTVLSQKLGTCLDMALLYASCLEAIGIHPLIAVVRGHAFAGGWLLPETFPDSITDDISFLNKRVADGINEITLVETTCMNHGSNDDFEQSVRKAGSRLLDPDAFILALDVKRSRFAGIKPLPQRIPNGVRWEIMEESAAVDKNPAQPESVNPYDLSGISSGMQITKQLMWERKLLDLSLRNNLLNIRITKNTLQLISVNPDIIEDALANGDEFRILPKPSDWENPLYGFGLYRSPDALDPVRNLIEMEISQKRLRSYLPEQDLDRALKHLYRSSRLSIEENGANTLYIALGLLKWFETPGSERPRYAPILLFPVEIIRKSAAKGYVIRSREEETMMNVTLLEMLRHNFGITVAGLEPLPVDENGIDVKRVYAIIRQHIKNQSRWDVEEQALLGIFSFNKFIMWNDIHNNSRQLVENKVVSSLISGKIEWEIQEGNTDAAVLDKELTPADIVLPIGADSSQLEAIYEAVNEKSYILHGPPGTGKSQTITNIIANALYRGKRVLFVAEKMAALSVVQNRLKAIGLSPFCLELHSNRAQKSSVMSQLKETSEIVKKTPPENFRQEAERIHKLRNELNTYIDALHRKYPFGCSLYDAITRYLAIGNEPETVFPQLLLKNLTEDKLSEWRDAVDSMESVGRACGHPCNHPLSEINIDGYSLAAKENAARILRETIDLLSEIESKTGVVARLFGEKNIAFRKRSHLTVVAGIIDRLLHIPELTVALLTLPRPDETLNEYREVVKHGKKRDESYEYITAGFSEDVLFIPAKQRLAAWNQLEGQWFIPKFFGRRKIRKELSTCALKPLKNPMDEILNRIIDYQREKEYLRPYTDMPALFGRFGKKNREEWTGIEQILDDCSEINALVLKLTGDVTVAAKLKETLAAQLFEGITPFKNMYGNDLPEISRLLSELADRENRLNLHLGIRPEDLYEENAQWIEYAGSRLNRWLNNIDKLKDWCRWLAVRNELRRLQIGFIATDYQKKNIPTASLQNFFNKSFYHAAILYIISKEPTLEIFKGKLFNETIRKYKTQTADFERLVRKELFAGLASRIPSFTVEATKNSEVGILQRNIRNNARGISVRRLFDQIPVLLSRMCPCMLMSPISVAQYIDPCATGKFDLIIFDEASQMPTYEAVGAIARGKSVVIVGDPKQMPPTNFFSIHTVDEENIEMEDLESILDDCLALSMPSKYLLWHYRSKHESLITFSNSEYYDNKLFTFPSPDNIESKVRFVPVKGVYDKGRTRQNRDEARAVTDEIKRRLSDEKLRGKSIGVVTFSSVQQTLVEDMLSDLFVERPDLESIALEGKEPLFVKNLENVQGDERDIILFSVGYGPDESGQVSMNFGPLNRLGGERRLNVAVSRARYEMIIFSALTPDMIDLKRTSSVGVTGLKRFLEYARMGEKTPAEVRQNTQEASAIEHIIAEELRKRGFTAHTNVGCSGYRINIGVVDKNNPARYVLGILCDGENYRQAKTARDREIVQTNALRQLGWNICRIWTMDWWENPQEVLDDISEEIRRAEENRTPSTDIQPEENAAATFRGTFEIPPPPEKRLVQYARSYTPAPLEFSYYPVEYFLLPENRQVIMSKIRKVMDAEAPVSRSLLCKRILTACGIYRSGQRLDACFESLLRSLPYYRTTNEDGAVFLWKDRSQCDNYQIYRTNSDRDAPDLPAEEVANAVKQVLQEQVSLPIPD
ncbi:MAG: DUF3320 domain-containing protein, partial [Tannerella sp.]|nr:DUF3320 domain-containing protein [Tannerella sp.]